MKSVDIPPRDRSISNWDVLVRVLNHNEIEDFDDKSSHRSSVCLQKQLSYEDKVKWRDILLTESLLRNKLTKATAKEDFEKIRHDVQYNTLFDAESWEVIIRILTTPGRNDDITIRKCAKREVWDTRSRRSSLPTLYEYDSDGNSSVRTIINDIVLNNNPLCQYHKNKKNSLRSSYRSDKTELRSMSEVTVDFRQPDNLENENFIYRSNSQPSSDQWDTV